MHKLFPALFAVMLVSGSAPSVAGEAHQARLSIVTGGIIDVINNSGSVTVHQGSQHQVIVNSTTHSGKVQVDARSTVDGKRVEVRAYPMAEQKPDKQESEVDCDITVPSGASITVSTSTALITLDRVSGDLSLSSDTGSITVRNATNSYLRIRSVAAPVVLSNVTGNVEITSSDGSVQLSAVSGSKVRVDTAGGNIVYEGNFAGGGSYSFTTHTGAIDVSMPGTASVDVTAKSFSGDIEDDFPLKAKPQTFVTSPGRSFAGTSNSGSSSVELRSFSGKIRLKKQ